MLEELGAALDDDLERIASTGELREYHFPPNTNCISEWRVRTAPTAEAGARLLE